MDPLDWNFDPSTDLRVNVHKTATNRSHSTLIPWDINGYGVLTRDAEIKAFRKLEAARKAGLVDVALKTKHIIIMCNLTLMAVITKRYRNLSDNTMSRLVEELYFCLDGCVDRFDVNLNIAFSTFAVRSMSLYAIRVLKKIFDEPTRITFSDLELDTAYLSHEKRDTQIDITPLLKLMNQLSKTDREVILDRYGLLPNGSKNHEEFYKRHGLRPNTARQFLKRALERLRIIALKNGLHSSHMA